MEEGAIDGAVVRDVLGRCSRGEISAPLAAMQILLAARGGDPLGAALEALAAIGGDVAPEVALLLRAHGPRCATVAARARGPMATRLEAIADFFDAAALESEEAAVALYSLGDPALLDAATAELVAAIASLGVLAPDRVALDLGCGIGRLAIALSPRLAAIHGVDVSARMIAAARRRAREIGNLHFSTTPGRDLRPFADGYFDLVLAIDALPYVHEAGMLGACFAEMARVLRPGGDVVAVNISYRDDVEADRATVRALAGRHGFDVHVEGKRPFTLWDRWMFHMRRAEPT
ncbi:MAG: class I SAM-dependent methyltransferase [Minicystis sp.]